MPTELSGYAVVQDNKQVEESKKAMVAALTSLYEKARYSNVECSKEEVQSVKNILK